MFRIMLIILLTGLSPIPCNAEFRDPTQPAYQLPAADDTGGDTELVLSAIWISPHSRRATINGILARQGQTIDIEQASALHPEPATSYVAPGISLPPDSMESLKTARIPARSNTIKIISIHKNSVTITQNGELKTLQLVQRPYKIQ